MASQLILGQARKMRTLIESAEWQLCRQQTGLSVQEFDETFSFALFNISVQPLANSYEFLSPEHRLMQISIPNELLIWVYFRIEPDDECCTLLWMESQRIRRVG